MVWCAMVCGMVGVVWYEVWCVVWYGVCGVVWGVVWCVVWGVVCGVVWCVWCGVVWCVACMVCGVVCGVVWEPVVIRLSPDCIFVAYGQDPIFKDQSTFINVGKHQRCEACGQ